MKAIFAIYLCFQFCYTIFIKFIVWRKHMIKKYLIIIVLLVVPFLLTGCTTIFNNNSNAAIYTITFHVEDGTNEHLSVNVQEGDRYPFTGYFYTPVREGYMFDGWYKDSDYTGTSYAYINSVVSNVSLYAKWSVADNTGNQDDSQDEQNEEIIITYIDGNDITNYYTQTINTNEATVLDLIKFTAAERYVFLGWSNVKGGNILYIDGQYATFSQSTTLYAVWEDTVRMVYLRSNNNAQQVICIEVEFGNNFVVPENNFIDPTGKVFVGWEANINSIVVEYNPGDVITLYNELNLYAIWKIPVTISFHSDGGSNVSSVVGGMGMRVPSEGYLPTSTKSGYIFMGWYTQIGGEGIFYNYFSSLNQNITLYASWRTSSADGLRAEEHYILNQETEKTYRGFNSDGYIINQSLTTVFEYGADKNQNGCGWIAIYNVLNYLKIQGKYDREIIIADIIRYCEHYGLVFDGALGTSPSAIQNYFRTLGFTVSEYSSSSSYDGHIATSDACITLFIILQTGHYEAISPKESGFYSYNPSVVSYNNYQEFKNDYGFGVYYLYTIDVN